MASLNELLILVKSCKIKTYSGFTLDVHMSELSEGRNKTNLRRARELTLSMGVGLLVALVFIGIWRGYEKQVLETAKNRLNLTGLFISDQYSGVLRDNIQTLQNMKSRLEETNGEYFDFWVHDASLILHQNPSFLLVEWIDSNMTIQRIEPVKGNEAALGLNLAKVEYRRAEWLKSAGDSSVNITHWAELTQKGHAFLVDAPVYYNNRFQGTITAGMDFTSHFNEIIDGRGSFSIKLYDQKGNLFYEWGAPHPNSTLKYEVGIPLKTEGQSWKFEMSPGVGFYEENQFFEYKVGLVLGLIIAFAIAVITYFMQRSSWESRRITEVNRKLKILNIELELEKQRALKATRVKTEFLSNMSHEIRTPLNAILGLVTILQSEGENERQREKYLGMMEFSSKNLLSIVNDILEIDKVESGGIELNLKPFSPLAEVESLLNLYEEGFERKNVKLIRNFPARTSIQVNSDPVKFGQIVTNLIRNAYKFTEEGTVEVSLEEELSGEYLNLRLTISDTGIGIPEESIDVIFDRFAQVETGLKRKYEGTGLGLAITKKLVERLGGKISVKSKLNVGSSFTVEMSLPIIKREEFESAETPLLKSEGNRILVAEDNPMNVMVITKLLEARGFNIEVVSNGEEAVDACESSKYDLIFMDIHMPGMDGIEATTRIRKAGIKTPIVALSANVTNEAVRDARAAGMQDYVTKPFTREGLEEIIYKYLGNAHKNQ